MTDNITAEDVEHLDSDSTALILTLMQQSTKDAAFTTNALMHGYRDEASRLRAELAAIRWAMQNLFKDGFQPSESRIINALWPSSDLIQDLLESDPLAHRD
jgi:hypothetical protein